MIKLLETIRFENGAFSRLDLHKQRMNHSRKELLNCSDEIDLERELEPHAYEAGLLKNDGVFKCRIIYAEEMETIDFTPYRVPAIESLKLVADDQITYDHKYLDRSHLDRLFRQKGSCDDIIIVRDGFVTDTWFANLLFFDGMNWFTPENPLLQGTQRAHLLQSGRVKRSPITESEVRDFQKARLVNAMIRFEDQVDINIENILK